MTPDRMAALHQAAFTRERPWQAQEFADLIAGPFVTLHARPHGFALSRTVAGESELLTLAVDPAHQGQGLGRALLLQWLGDITAQDAFLEVAADNTAALALYHSVGFAETGRRPGYYQREGARNADAILMRKELTLGQAGDSPRHRPESG